MLDWGGGSLQFGLICIIYALVLHHLTAQCIASHKLLTLALSFALALTQSSCQQMIYPNSKTLDNMGMLMSNYQCDSWSFFGAVLL